MKSTQHSAASLLDAIRQGEGAFVEFKSSFQKEVIETLTAFANTQGGAVLMGVGDAGQIVGVTVQAETVQGWINQCKQITTFVAYGLPEPEFEATQGGMAVTVFSAVGGGVSGGVNTESVPLLQLIQVRPGLKTTELVAQTGKPQRTIERWLKQLKDSQQIEFRGAPKTGGYYCKNT